MHNDTKKQFDLQLGQVDFINCLPINLPIELGEIKINANILNAVPSELNAKILSGEIDIAPISSFAYLENKDKLQPISDLCISSNGPADSVLFFSKFPIEELDGKGIALSAASATSNKLLEIICKEFLNINITTFDIVNSCSARLLIGDHALMEFSKMSRDLFIYDLGSLWKKYTGLPMVFGIWVARKEIVELDHELPLIINKLQESKQLGLGKLFDKVVKKAQEKILLSTDFYNNYFQHLSYDLTDECKKGLMKFEESCNKLKENKNVVSVTR